MLFPFFTYSPINWEHLTKMMNAHNAAPYKGNPVSNQRKIHFRCSIPLFMADVPFMLSQLDRFKRQIDVKGLSLLHFDVFLFKIRKTISAAFSQRNLSS